MRLALLAALALVAACSGPRAAIQIEDMRCSRDGEKVVADLDLFGVDQLGGNIGTYCATLTFPGETPVASCYSDLEDGDRRTLRWVSTTNTGAGAIVSVRVRLGNVDQIGTCAAP